MSFLIRVIRANPWRKSALEPGGGEPDQLLRGLAPLAGIADPGGALDQAEVGHGVGQRDGQEVQAPVQLLLAQLGAAGRDRPREIAQHVAVALGQELAQAVVLFRIRDRKRVVKGKRISVRVDRGGRRIIKKKKKTKKK